MRLLACAIALLCSVNTAAAIVVRNDPGGDVIRYSIKAQKTKTVRFDGQCVSACTLFLTVKDKCLTPRATFGFHRAYGASKRINDAATQHMWERYPDWVRRWITANGGLTSRMIVMPNSYARKHMRAC